MGRTKIFILGQLKIFILGQKNLSHRTKIPMTDGTTFLDIQYRCRHLLKLTPSLTPTDHTAHGEASGLAA